MGRVSDAMWRAGQHEDEPADAAEPTMPVCLAARIADSSPARMRIRIRRLRFEPRSPSRCRRVEALDPRAPRRADSDRARRAPTPVRRRGPDPRRAADAVPTPLADGRRDCDRRRRRPFAYNHLAVPIYEARARLILEPNSPEVVPFRGPSRKTRAGSTTTSRSSKCCAAVRWLARRWNNSVF